MKLFVRHGAHCQYLIQESDFVPRLTGLSLGLWAVIFPQKRSEVLKQYLWNKTKRNLKSPKEAFGDT